MSDSRHSGDCVITESVVLAPALALSVLLGLAPAAGLACACGCGVFDVGTVSMLPSGPGGAIYVEDDYMNQNQNWAGAHAAPASANTDKELQTNFGNVGLDYQFNNDWGATAELPYWDRLFRTDIGTPTAPDVTTFRHSAIGDVRLTASDTEVRRRGRGATARRHGNPETLPVGQCPGDDRVRHGRHVTERL